MKYSVDKLENDLREAKRVLLNCEGIESSSDLMRVYNLISKSLDRVVDLQDKWEYINSSDDDCAHVKA
jgi:hypothetical protein